MVLGVKAMVYLFLAEGFEEVEALCPLDLLRRAGVEVTTVGVGGDIIRGSHKISVGVDMRDTMYNDYRPEMIILPGGMPGTVNLDSSDTVDMAIRAAVNNNSYIAAICAAPMILGKRGLLEGKRAVCFPGFEGELAGAKVEANEKVVRDGSIITAKGMGVALEFGLELVSLLKGKDAADRIKKSVQA